MATEKRLIDVNKPIKETESIIYFRMCHHMPTEDYESFLNYLKKQPTVDAVEVVRCRACKYSDYAFDKYWCEYFWNKYQSTPSSYEVKADGFCHNGERKDK